MSISQREQVEDMCRDMGYDTWWPKWVEALAERLIKAGWKKQ